MSKIVIEVDDVLFKELWYISQIDDDDKYILGALDIFSNRVLDVSFVQD